MSTLGCCIFGKGRGGNFVSFTYLEFTLWSRWLGNSRDYAILQCCNDGDGRVERIAETEIPFSYLVSGAADQPRGDHRSLPIRYRRLCLSFQICVSALHSCQNPTLMIFIPGGIDCPGLRFSFRNHGMAKSSQTPDANAISTDRPQFYPQEGQPISLGESLSCAYGCILVLTLLASESLTRTPNMIPTITARMTISPTDWM
jgi:hypothetical protein